MKTAWLRAAAGLFFVEGRNCDRVTGTADRMHGDFRPEAIATSVLFSTISIAVDERFAAGKNGA